MKIYDISVTTSPQTVTWDNEEKPLSLEWMATTEQGDVCNGSILSGCSHMGTHLDAPLHFIHGGATVESLDLTALIGPAQVVEIFDRDQITAEDFESAGLAASVTRVLLKTNNTRRKLLRDPKFHPEYVGVAPSGAQWLVDHSISLVGLDYLSAGPYGALNVETHRILLGAGLVIVESLQLEDVAAGQYTLLALPPKLHGAEGSPCRAVLIEGNIE